MYECLNINTIIKLNKIFRYTKICFQDSGAFITFVNPMDSLWSDIIKSRNNIVPIPTYSFIMLIGGKKSSKNKFLAYKFTFFFFLYIILFSMFIFVFKPSDGRRKNVTVDSIQFSIYWHLFYGININSYIIQMKQSTI